MEIIQNVNLQIAYKVIDQTNLRCMLKGICEINSSKSAVTIAMLAEFFRRKREVVSCITIRRSCLMQLLVGV